MPASDYWAVEKSHQPSYEGVQGRLILWTNFHCRHLSGITDALFSFNWKAMKELPSSIGNLTSLVELSLSKCVGLSSIPPSIGKCQAIEDLILNKCKSLTELPDSICGLRNVCLLDLRGMF